ncbi:MAG: hypothetical protein J0L64_09155 [Acidobacteria bacterium]|nr:hypothetical protein [Acidobacteriota bacterium]
MNPTPAFPAPGHRHPLFLLTLSLLFTLLACQAKGQTISPQRPRLFMNAERIADIRAKINGTPAQRQQWNTYRAGALKIMKELNLGSAHHAAFLSLFEPEAQFNGRSLAQFACEVAAFHTDLDNPDPRGLLNSVAKVRNGNSNRWYGPNIARIYDWTYSSCTEAQRATLNKWFEMVVSTNKEIVGFSGPSYRVSNNIAIGMLRTNIFAAIASYEPGVTDDRQEWLRDSIDRFRKYAIPCLNNESAVAPLESCAGGSWPEGVEYMPETKYIYWDVMEGVRTGTTDTDLFAEAPRFVLESARYHILSTSPASRKLGALPSHEPFIYRDVQQVGLFYVYDREMMVRLGWHLRRAGDRDNAMLVQWWLNNVQPRYLMTANSNGEQDWFDLLYHEPDAPEQSFAGAPGLSPNLLTPFMLLSRSSWDPKATWVGFQAMIEGGDHMHSDAGQFQIYRGGKWLTREVPGYIGAFAQNSQVHNIPILNFHGGFTSTSRYGGGLEDWARFTRRDPSAYLAECSQNGEYCYAQADLSGVYRFSGYFIAPDVDRGGAMRDFLYIKPDLVVIQDYFRYIPGLSAVSLTQIQALEEPTIEGSKATLSNGDQRLYVTVTEPLDAKIRLAKADGPLRVLGARRIDENSVDLYVDGGHGLPNNGSVTITGARDGWEAINGTWKLALPLPPTKSGYPYLDGVAYNGERFRITSPGAFSSITKPWDTFAQEAFTDRVRQVKVSGAAFPGYRLEIGSGQYLNEERQFVVLQAADAPSGQSAASQPMKVSRQSSESASAAQIGRYVVASPKKNVHMSKLSYSYQNLPQPLEHYVIRLKPEQWYYISDAGGSVTLSLEEQPGPKANVTCLGKVQASQSGVVRFRTGVLQKP